jgi:SAM-dependent methyltransferase
MNKNKDIGLKRKLEVLASSVLDSTHKEEFGRLSDRFGMKKKDIVDMVLNYTISGGDFENDEYKDVLMRATLHLHNEVDGTYHKKKENFVKNALTYNNSKSFVDIGYGVPSGYIFDAVSRGLEACLLDQDEKAEEFSRELLSIRESANNRVSYDVHDMNNFDYVGNFDSYVMLDSIEHCLNPTKYLEQLVKKSRDDSRFIFSIPLMKLYRDDGSKVNNFHYAEWVNRKDAVDWLEDAGLRILNQELIIPNPDIDFFAYKKSPDKPSYRCFMVNCEKEAREDGK